MIGCGAVRNGLTWRGRHGRHWPGEELHAGDWQGLAGVEWVGKDRAGMTGRGKAWRGRKGGGDWTGLARTGQDR